MPPHALRAHPLRAAAGLVLREAGFRVRRNSWFKASDEVVAVVNLQKSQWGDQYYVNVGLWLRALGEHDAPPEYQCHIRVRADSVVANPLRLTDLLNMETDIDASTRSSELAAIFSTELLSFVNACSTLDDVRNAMKTLENILMSAEAAALLRR